jgi:hypothetical protein
VSCAGSSSAGTIPAVAKTSPCRRDPGNCDTVPATPASNRHLLGISIGAASQLQIADRTASIPGVAVHDASPGPLGMEGALGEKQPWHARFYLQAYSDFSVPAPPPADGFAYWIAVVGTLPFGVWVEPPWRKRARFRLLQFPGRIPVIAVALPLLLAYAAYRTSQGYGVWHVILPFAAVAAGATVSLALLGGFNLLRGRV